MNNKCVQHGVYLTDGGTCPACERSARRDFKPDAKLPNLEVKEAVNHPKHYGGDTTYETIKVIEAWDLNFNLGNTVKYISRAGKKGNKLEDLKKAMWYLKREIENEDVA